jgi:hypothetical protein
VKGNEPSRGQARDYSGVAFALEGAATNGRTAALFAVQIKDKYKFSSESADPFQTVKDWLLSYRSLMRGLK